MERATEPTDMVDCLLLLCNGHLKFQPVPKGILDWIQQNQQKDHSFIIKVDDIQYVCQDVFFAYIPGAPFWN